MHIHLHTNVHFIICFSLKRYHIDVIVKTHFQVMMTCLLPSHLLCCGRAVRASPEAADIIHHQGADILISAATKTKYERIPSVESSLIGVPTAGPSLQ